MYNFSTVQYNNNVDSKDKEYVLEMSAYPNILTPPSSNEDSPQSYNLGSPQYYIQSTSPTNMLTMKLNKTSIQPHYFTDINYVTEDQDGAYLTITEQPTDKFRFRYKSEMAGTHGSLTGYNSDKTRKQTYPSVKLHNFHGNGVVRCSLYQCTNSSDRQPHAHRLIKKHGSEEVDDPHDCRVNPHDGFDVCFHSMGIIHTAKKHIVGELIRKKKLLKLEEIALRENKKRELTRMEDSDIKRIAEEESKSINLNIVCLRFDAFEVLPSGILNPICAPLYSHAINNLKSALTGELKIVRMDHASSPAKGNLEIYMLVEKVTKKNIKIRFFELDDEENEIWDGYGSFSDLDVHHQYAIVFKTPPYRDLNIEFRKTVFIELLRPSDGSRSDALQFTYYPSNNLKQGAKRARVSDYSSSNSYNSMSSGELPIPIIELPMDSHESPLQITSEDLQKAMQNVNSDEFNKLYMDLHDDFSGHLIDANMMIPALSTDAPKSNVKAQISKLKYKPFVPDDNISKKDKQIVQRVYDEFDSYVKINPQEKDQIDMLDHLFREYVNDNGDNALHIAVMDVCNLNVVKFLVGNICRLNQHRLFAMTNKMKETIMHVAVQFNNQAIVKYLLENIYDVSHQDGKGNTILHIAVESSNLIFRMVLKYGLRLKLNINAENNHGRTALHEAVQAKNLCFVELLHKSGAYINSIERQNGRTILHMAVEQASTDIVEYLLNNTKIDILIKDFNGMTASTMSKRLKDNSKSHGTIFTMCQEYMERRGLFDECMVKDELPDSDEEMEVEVEIKSEKLSAEDLEKLYEGVVNFTPRYLDMLSEILDDSGNWESLAELLDLGHLLHTDLFAKAKSPSKTVLNSAVTLSNVLEIRNFLEYLGEVKAVNIIDEMAMSNKT